MYRNESTVMPMLALRGLSVFPGMMLTFDVERSASIAALNQAVRSDQMIFLARDIVKRIESELEYPGQIKVNLIRESRRVEYAK